MAIGALGLVAFSLFVPSIGGSADSALADARARVQLTLDTSEADGVLRLLALSRSGRPIAEEDWRVLFATEPYRRLRQREAKIGEQFHDPRRAFTDGDFRRFVLSEELGRRAADLERTLDRWKSIDLATAAERVLHYLPASAKIRAKVYPVVKPARNSFVWEASSDPAIFLYVDPQVSAEKFANTVAHELHHIGLASAQVDYEREIETLPERARTAAKWMGAFGEGLAMLAAAGGPEIDPHRASSPEERSRWNHDLANFADDLRAVNRFFLDILDGTLAGDAVDAKGSSFFGAQGPWYTVGYEMAVLVEKRFGRDALIQTMLDPRRLLSLYNRAAEEESRGHERLPLWSPVLLDAVHADAPDHPRPRRPTEARSYGVKSRSDRLKPMMRVGRIFLALTGSVALAGLAAAQQQPIFGCHGSLSCRSGPVRDNALNDPTAGSMLFGVGVAWSPGIHFRVALPGATPPTPTPIPAVDLQKFRLRGVRLLPQPTVTPAPSLSPTPAALPR